MHLRTIKSNREFNEIFRGRTAESFSVITGKDGKLLGYFFRMDDGHLIALRNSDEKVVEMRDGAVWRVMLDINGEPKEGGHISS